MASSRSSEAVHLIPTAPGFKLILIFLSEFLCKEYRFWFNEIRPIVAIVDDLINPLLFDVCFCLLR